MGNEWGLEQSQGCRNSQKVGKELVSVIKPSGFATWCSLKLGLYSPTEIGI